MHGDDGNEETRIDKWLWAARFFKTRALGAAAVNGGKVDLHGQARGIFQYARGAES